MLDNEVVDVPELEREEYDRTLASVSEDILLDNILDQIDTAKDKKSLYERTNLFEFFTQRINYALHKYGQLEDDRYGETVTTISDVLDRVTRALGEKFGFEVIYSDVIPLETKLSYVDSLYNFFIVDLGDHLSSLVTKDILEYKDTYAQMLSELDKQDKKNVSYLYLEEIINNQYTTLIYNLKDVINTLEAEQTIEDTIEGLIADDPNEYHSFIINQIFLENQWVDINVTGEGLFNELKPLIYENDKLFITVKNKLINALK